MKPQIDILELFSGIMAFLPSQRTEDKVKIISRPHGYNKGNETDISPTLKSSSFEHNNYMKNGSSIRRLTEIECERLQGFPDGFTQYGIYNGIVKPIPKTQRYKMCGNAVTVAVVKAIAERINLKPITR